MCGFVGFSDLAKTNGEDKMRIATDMTESIRHRGPDDIGYYSDDRVTLGFARLKIIDLEGGHQPMVSRDGRFVLCFNGEIYNFRELRAALIRCHGVRFSTESDTEVLLEMLVRYGDGALAELRGMYAFAFYDRESGDLLLARDPFGIKPLYYAAFDGCFMFSSEIKALLSHPKFKKELNTDILPYYLQMQYVPTEETAFRGVRRLLQGHLLIKSGESVTVSRYFEPPRHGALGYLTHSFFGRDGDETPRRYLSDRFLARKKIKDAVCGSVKSHTVADTPVGAFLSGGVDSGYIVSVARPKSVFSVGFDGYGFDESALARERAEAIGAKIETVTVGADEFFGSVSAVQYHSDEPYANLSAVPLFLLARKARESVGVILSGEGADELFGGYELYRSRPLRRICGEIPPSAVRRIASGRLKRSLEGARLDRDFIGQARIMTEAEAFSLLAPPYRAMKSPTLVTADILSENKGATSIRRKMLLDMQLWLPLDILNKADKMTMASSVELRVPYLDLSVLAASEALSDRLLIRGKTTKYALRFSASEELGTEAAFRKKKGFPVPFRDWIRGEKYAEILKTAFTGAIGRRFFNTELLLEMLSAHISGEKDNARRLYTVYSFIEWYRIYFGDGEEMEGSVN